MVCFIDLIYPPKLMHRTVVTDDDTKGDTAQDSVSQNYYGLLIFIKCLIRQ